jgi:hypothetical protein
MADKPEHVWHSSDIRSAITCALCGQSHPNPYNTVLPFNEALASVPLWHCHERAAIQRKFEVMARRRQ